MLQRWGLIVAAAGGRHGCRRVQHRSSRFDWRLRHSLSWWRCRSSVFVSQQSYKALPDSLGNLAVHWLTPCTLKAVARVVGLLTMLCQSIGNTNINILRKSMVNNNINTFWPIFLLHYTNTNLYCSYIFMPNNILQKCSLQKMSNSLCTCIKYQLSVQLLNAER